MASDSTMAPHVLRNVLDVCIIGGGPAGLSAALSLGRVLRSAVVFDSGDWKAHSVSRIGGAHDQDNPSLIRNGLKAELQRKYKTIMFAKTGARTVREAGPVFEVEDENGRYWKSRKVILATGTRDVLLDIAGYKECWGKGIYNCLHRSGFENFGAVNAAVLLTSTSRIKLSDAISCGQLARQFSTNICLLTNGTGSLAFSDVQKASEIHSLRVDDRKIRRLQTLGYNSDASMVVEFEDGTTSSFGFLFHKPDTVPNGSFAEQLGLCTTHTGDVSISGSTQETSRRGVFAAGDCATQVKHVSVAMGAGSAAGVGANAQILQDDFEKDW
ncbi:Thioredoxin reductase sirT [Colletotrichum gloeosporioides]|uniref:Thioredoxin reductase sirT n=1 Tax=Colletotrichum gloeosporioides TaxID=474922 RepID=A0A8H4CC75_COLGL|nr:Thioredoxin reductase sirT [Colletotrichum gloeosporioides]KAF3801164.1 Thioredoxin reductase sirT [Colletotrichum gloeosporioides]